MVVLEQKERIPNDFLSASKKSFIGNSSTHVHEFFELEYVIRGKGTCIVDGKEYPMHEGALFLLSPINTHAVRDADAALFNVMFRLEYDPSLPLLSLFPASHSPYFSPNESDRALLYALLSEIVSIHEENTGYARRLLECVLEKLRLLSAHEAERTALPYIRRAILYTTEHFREDISLERTAACLGLSPTYFSELFSRETGKSFKQYLDTLRFSHAKELLAFTDLPVSEVHRLSGFADYANFSRRFKSAFGMTPTDYRRKKKNGDF